MKAGALRTRVFIEQQSATQDSVGQLVNTWATLATVWAEIKYRRGLESIAADSMTAVAVARVRIRYRSDVTPGMRLKYGGIIYNITAVLPDVLTKDYLDLMCEVVN